MDAVTALKLAFFVFLAQHSFSFTIENPVIRGYWRQLGYVWAGLFVMQIAILASLIAPRAKNVLGRKHAWRFFRISDRDGSDSGK